MYGQAGKGNRELSETSPLIQRDVPQKIWVRGWREHGRSTGEMNKTTGIVSGGKRSMEKKTETERPVRLDEEILDQVSGGYLYINEEGALEVIDGNGNVVATYTGPNAKRDAHNKCAELGLSIKFITYGDLEALRNKPDYIITEG